MISVLIPSSKDPQVHDVVKAVESVLPGCEIIICNDRYRYGKGWAVREALGFASGSLICMIDGDMDIHPRMFNRLLPFLDDYDIVVGKKQVRGILSRRLLTVCSRLWITLLFGINYDTQTGIKIFKRQTITDFATKGFMFDLEILAKAQRKGFKIIEVPVEVTGSKHMKLASVWQCLKETIKLRRFIDDKHQM